MKRLEHKHPRPVRWMHWFNVPLLFGMIWSGLLIYWANDVYRIGFGDWTLWHFFPNWFYDMFGLTHRLAEGMAWHFTIMWLFAHERAVLRHLYLCLRRVAVSRSESEQLPRGVDGGSARPALEQGRTAAPQIQRRNNLRTRKSF